MTITVDVNEFASGNITIIVVVCDGDAIREDLDASAVEFVVDVEFADIVLV